MLFDINMKEVKSRQGPSTYRPNYDNVLNSNPKYSIQRSNKKSHFEDTMG